MKGTGAKRNVCPGSCVSTGAKFPVAAVESAPICLLSVVQLHARCPRNGLQCNSEYAIQFRPSFAETVVVLG